MIWGMRVVIILLAVLAITDSYVAHRILEECPRGFLHLGRGCYFYAYFRLNWFRAMEFCHSFGPGVSLAAIETPEENDDIKMWLKDNGDPNTGVWVSGSDNGHPGVWSWFGTGQLLQGADWGVGQPRGGDHHCLYLVGGGLGQVAYQWADFHCDFKMTFMCEDHGVLIREVEEKLSDEKKKNVTTIEFDNDLEKHKASDLREAQEELDDENVDEIEPNDNENATLILSEKFEEDFEQKEKDEADWSIFQFIKNMIQLPFLFLMN